MGVIVCRLTKRSVLFACNQNITAEEFGSLFIKEWVKHFGLPERMISDRDRIFKGTFWNSVCSRLKIENRMSSGYHPQTDGQSERVIHILEQYLRNFINYQQDNWVEFLPLAEFAYNNTYQVSIKTTPFMASSAFSPRFDSVSTAQRNESANQFAKLMDKELTLLKLILSESMDKYKKFADENRKDVEFNVGDMVWLSSSDYNTERPNKKLSARRLGPYKVIERFGQVAYKLKLPHSIKIHPVFHVSKLAKYTENKFNSGKRREDHTVVVDEDEAFDVDSILDSKYIRGRLFYLVSFLGLGPDDDLWLPVGNLDCPEKID